MAVTDEELKAKRQRVADLNDKLFEANQAAQRRAREAENDVTADALDAEAARLEAEYTALVRAEEAADLDSDPSDFLPLVNPGNGTPVESQQGDGVVQPSDAPVTEDAPSQRDDDGIVETAQVDDEQFTGRQ